MSDFNCTYCKIKLNSQSQWDQHLTGAKHLRLAALQSTNQEIESQTTLGAALDIASAIYIGEDGRYKCKYCEDFTCAGPIPMRQHVIGQKHLKAVQRCTISNSLVPTQSNISLPAITPEDITEIVAVHALQAAAADLLKDAVVDMSSAITLPDGKYGCKDCPEFTASGLIPMQQHLQGKPHSKNVLKHIKESSPVKITEPLTIQPLKLLTPSDPEMSSALLQPDGTYKCKDCEEFVCTGTVPMKAHLNGKLHSKNVLRNGGSPQKRVLPQISPTIALNKRPTRVTSPEYRVEQAWKHPIMCGYSYDDNFGSMSLDMKVNALIPHFAFIAQNEPIPNLLKYLNK